MKRSFIAFLLFALMMTGCASGLGPMPSGDHTAALMVGDAKDNVVAQAEQVCGKPKLVGYGAKDTPDEFEIRRYRLFADADLVLYFYKGVFFQADLIEPKSTTYLGPRKDYKEVTRNSPGPAGYLLTVQGKTTSIKTLLKDDKAGKQERQ